MAVSRRKPARGRVRPLEKRLDEAKDKVDKLELQFKIQELRARVKRQRRR